VKLICYEARQGISIPLSLEFPGLERHQMPSEDNEDHPFDTSSLRHLKVFEGLNV
jgi:hypothetical protein